ncbi:metallophosphoesterase [Plantibacter sp. YIM 135249]|uniref:metallophosphoesterase n=1 Tax=Plantibacter sp. YIM 135249 TaxID=3423918 RepID=UPI003D356B77
MVAWQLGDEVVAVAGDWHGNVRWVQRALPALVRVAPHVRTMLHLGDFGIWPGRPPGFLGTVDYWCRRSGFERILVTPGNHDDWDQLVTAFEAAPGEPVQLSEYVWALPRGYRFNIGGRTVMSFGGAASFDAAERIPGRTWWAAEMPTIADVAAAIAPGAVDLLLTHDAPPELADLVTTGEEMSPDARRYVAASAARIGEVWRSVSPAVLAHGHLHRQGTHHFPDRGVVYGLAADGSDGNLALLRMRDLSWEWVRLTQTGTVSLVPDETH